MRRGVRFLRFCDALLFPRRCPFCDEVLGFSGPCAACAQELVKLTRPVGKTVPAAAHVFDGLDAVYAPYLYEGTVRDAILRMKFGRRPDLAVPLAEKQAAFLYAAGDGAAIDAVCFVPASRRERGARRNAAPALLARTIGRAMDRPVLCALEKTRKTQKQKTLSGEARRKNLAGAFAVRAGVSVQGMRMLLVDDVITTGATMSACAAALRKAGAAGCVGMGVAVVRSK